MVGQSGAILYLIPQIIYCFKTITCSMAPLHSTVDGLKMKNRCRQKEGVTLKHLVPFTR